MPPSPESLQAALLETVPHTDTVTILCCFVLHYPLENESAAYALISSGQGSAAGGEVYAAEWTSTVLSVESPIGRAVCEPPAGLGDTVYIALPNGAGKITAQIVSWNGSPLLTETEREACRNAQAQRESEAQKAQAEKRRAAAVCGKQNGIVADLRARRLEKEAEWRDATTASARQSRRS